MPDYYTDTWEVMNAVKRNLMVYKDTQDTLALQNMITWNLGFVFPQAVFPAITVFPLSKDFGLRESGGRQVVKYRFSIDIYSKKYLELEKSKQFVVRVKDDVLRAIKRYPHLIDGEGTKHSFATRILNVNILEVRDDKQRGFSSTASVEIECSAYHQFNKNRLYSSKIIESDYDTFLDKLIAQIQFRVPTKGINIKEYMFKIAKPITRTPALAILPGLETVDETRTGRYAFLNRAVEFHVMHKGILKKDIVKSNIKLADKIVDIIELDSMLEGHAQDCQINSINYVPNSEATIFNSVIDTEYTSRNLLKVTY